MDPTQEPAGHIRRHRATGAAVGVLVGGVLVGGVVAGAVLAGAVLAASRLKSRRGRPWRVVVEGRSMAPTLLPGDHLLLLRTYRPRPGDIIATFDPRGGGRILVKRVRTVSAAGLELRGDNTDASTDSRTFGPVPPAAVAGRVVYRYSPPVRTGRIGRHRAYEEPGQP